MFTGWDRPSHWLVLAIVVVVLFGYKKLPDAARSVGRSLRIFKTEIKGMNEDDAARAAAKAEIVPPNQPSAPPAEDVEPRPASEASANQQPQPAVNQPPLNSERKPAG